MTGLALKLFLGGLIKRLTAALTALWGFARAYPWQAALIASLCLSGWLWRGKQAEHRNYLSERAGRAADREAWQAASDDNAARALAQVQAAEAKSAAIAKESDNDHASYVSEGRAAASAYAASHRMQCKASPGISTAAAPAGGNNPRVPDEMPSEAFVAIRERDLQDTADLYAYALAAHNNAMDRIEAGLAKPPVDWPEPDMGGE